MDQSFRLRFELALLLEDYGVTFEYLPRKKNVAAVADALSRLDIDSLKIQEEEEEEEEVLTLLSGSGNSISNIKSIIPIHTALIFKEQAKVKEPGLRERAYTSLITQYKILKGMILFDTKKSNKIYIPQSFRQRTMSTVLVP
jgi:hypothetical protein